MDTENVDAVRKEVRDHYGQLSREGMGCCGTGGCCVANPDASEALGYTAEQLADAPEGANLGLGCGNPQAIARLTPGERVLDLGSGGGFDCFLAARQVGPTGHVIGVDMTPDMIERARGNAKKVSLGNVEFRLGRDRAPARRRRRGRRRHLELRDQPVAREVGGLPGGLPRPEAGRPPGDQRRRGSGAAHGRGEGGRDPVHGLRGGSCYDR